MNEEFITKAIEQDRYLKATRLAEQFESEVIREISNACEDVIEENKDLFVADVTPDSNVLSNRTQPLSTIRVDCKLDRYEAPVDNLNNLTLNVAMESMEPEERGHEYPSEGALCCVHYKIKGSTREEYEKVKEDTGQDNKWGIHFADDFYTGAPGVFYIPIQSAAEMKEALETLLDHFTQYSREFGVERPDST